MHILLDFKFNRNGQVSSVFFRLRFLFGFGVTITDYKIKPTYSAIICAGHGTTREEKPRHRTYV